jgi:para-aminobenzoate synthetase/4-amino-4-deoxychorismate lyase
MKVVLRHAGKWLHFQCPEKVLRTQRVDEVLPLLEEAERSGLHAAGFISYEAAPAFDSALKVNGSGDFPLLCLGLFPAPSLLDDIEEPPSAHYETGALKPTVSQEEFAEAIRRIKAYIAAGATYQVNYTYRLMGTFSGNPWAFFHALVQGQRAGHAAYIDTGDTVICSASPELFFSCRDGRIVSRPMKGTARRGRTFSEDWTQAEALRRSEKDRAENIMIVDMIRNDIGRVAVPGSVETVSTYDVEKYPTVWQMTSTVQGKSDANAASVLRALFPCASITGAPKAKTMEIIGDLETLPRKIYTGCIGFITPQGEFCFNVAIRTALVDRGAGTLEYGVGGGIVWDSNADAEYQETLTKARVLTAPRPDFQLLETMLWQPEEGIFLQEEHLQRLGRSAAYFDIPLDIHAVHSALQELRHTCAGVEHRIRLLVSRDGNAEIQTFPFSDGGVRPPARPSGRSSAMPRPDDPVLHVALAKDPVDSQDVFLFHKTTRRDVYENAKADFPDCDDVILWNEQGEVTEGTIANIVIRKDGRLVTPPIGCGLLAGTFRGFLLDAGAIEEGVITLDDLKTSREIFLVNSVRGWQRAELR